MQNVFKTYLKINNVNKSIQVKFKINKLSYLFTIYFIELNFIIKHEITYNFIEVAKLKLRMYCEQTQVLL